MVHFFMAVKTENYRIFFFFTFGQGKNVIQYLNCFNTVKGSYYYGSRTFRQE